MARRIMRPGGDRSIARRGVLGGGAATLATVALPLPAGAPTRRRDPVKIAKKFAGDVRLPGLLHAAIARPPLPGWRLAGFDAAAALAMAGVADVVPLDPSDAGGIARLGGLAVLARDGWGALRARDVIRPSWDAAGETGRDRAAPFFVPATAEPLMEPPTATVQAGIDGCAVWTACRAPQELRGVLAALLALAPEAVALHPTVPACGQGPANPAYAIEAALLSRAMGGAPVALAWTPADDLPFRDRPVSA